MKYYFSLPGTKAQTDVFPTTLEPSWMDDADIKIEHYIKYSPFRIVQIT